jgi:hypothetical protein
MRSQRISYEGVGGAVAGVLGIVGSLSAWFELDGLTVDGPAEATGTWAFAMAIATFAFGVAYVVMSDTAVRKISSVLMAVAAALMTASAIAGIGRADSVDATPGWGLWLTLVAGAIGMICGVLAVRASREAAVASEGAIPAAPRKA